LLCYTCPGLKDGAIAYHAAKLCHYFVGYYDFQDANLPEQYRSWLSAFQEFHQRLEHYADRPCLGCRETPTFGGCLPGCVVPSCVIERGIDYCAECSDFPCQEARDVFASANELLARSWEEGSRRIREIGIEAYFEEKRDTPHYAGYAKKEATVQSSQELDAIITKFAGSGWDVIVGPSQAWLSNREDAAVRDRLVAAVKEADAACGSCGCEFDPLYKRALELLQA
jgi:hypothetical protein